LGSGLEGASTRLAVIQKYVFKQIFRPKYP